VTICVYLCVCLNVIVHKYLFGVSVFGCVFVLVLACLSIYVCARYCAMFYLHQHVHAYSYVFENIVYARVHTHTRTLTHTHAHTHTQSES